MRTEGVTSMELSNLSLAPVGMRTEGVKSVELFRFRAIELTSVALIPTCRKNKLPTYLPNYLPTYLPTYL